jgi:Carboxylesterase family
LRLVKPISQSSSRPRSEATALQATLKKAYAIGSPGVSDTYDAIAQIATDVNYHCTAASVTNDSTLAGLPTWRYYFYASFANTNPSALLSVASLGGLNLEAFHTSEIAFVFGDLPANSTEQEVELSKYMQKAWTDFAKDPTVGPGWATYGSKKEVRPVVWRGLGSQRAQPALSFGSTKLPSDARFGRIGCCRQFTETTMSAEILSRILSVKHSQSVKYGVLPRTLLHTLPHTPPYSILFPASERQIHNADSQVNQDVHHDPIRRNRCDIQHVVLQS